MSDTFTIATFRYREDKWPKHVTLTWPDLVKRLTTFNRRERKEGAPLWSPTAYHDGKRREKANVESITLAVGDLDHDVVYGDIVQHLRSLGVAFVLHSTFRSTPEEPRLRVVIPLVQPVAAQDWERIKKRLDYHVFKHSDPSTADASRMYYWPIARPGALTFTEQGEGQLLDPYALPEAPGEDAGVKGNGHKQDSIPQTVVEGTRNDTLFHLACSLRQRGLAEVAIQAALEAVNAEHCSPPLADGEVEAIARSACRYEPGELNPPTAKVGQKTTANGAKKTAIETTEDVTLLRLSDVQPEPVRWLWPGRIPLGKLTILDGDPGLGKSLLTIDLAARISTGDPMPDGTQSDYDGSAGVVLLTAEDDPADTIRPRLDAAGADCSHIVLLQSIREVTTLPDGTVRDRTRLPNLGDIAALEKAIAEVEAKLIIVDPVMAYTAGADTHVDSEVRSVLSRLAELAQRTGVAILAVRHLNKAGGSNPLYRGGGSIGFIASARSGLLVAPDPDDMEGKRRILAATKSNLAELPPSLAYTIEAPTGAAKITWLGMSELTAKSLLAAPSDGEEKTALDEAKDFLRDLLSDGPVEAKQVKAEARDAGIAERTLARAKQLLAVQAVKSGFGDTGRWVWCLPSVNQSGEQPKDAKNPLRMPKNTNIESLASLGSFGTLRLSDRLQTDDVDRGPLQGGILARAERHNWPELPYAQGRRVLGGRANWQKAVEWGSAKELTLILEALREFGDD